MNEKDYSYKIMEKQISLLLESGESDSRENQRNKFKLLTELVEDLFHYKDVYQCAKTISNLIITMLISYNEGYPLDIYSDDDVVSKKEKEDYKELLKDELIKFSNFIPN